MDLRKGKEKQTIQYESIDVQDASNEHNIC